MKRSMKKQDIILFILPVIIVLGAVGCRSTGDDLLSYGQKDNQVYNVAKSSHAEAFKAFWTAMNENYCIWDYEAAHGIDWDEVYRTYLPKFEALDDTARQTPVTREELDYLYSRIINPLHDGHLAIQFFYGPLNYPLTYSPGMTRVMQERGDELAVVEKYLTKPQPYLDIAGEYHIEELDSVNGLSSSVAYVQEQYQRIIAACGVFLAETEPQQGGSESIARTCQLVAELRDRAIAGQGMTGKDCIAFYGGICDQYGSVGKLIDIQLNKVDAAIYDDGLQYLYAARFSGNIMYLRLGGFRLTSHLEPSMQTSDSATAYFAYQQDVIRVWHKWFDGIQSLHSEGRLGGVIIDVRNNNGGYVNDNKFVLGALLPSGGYKSCMLRMKTGIGRYDFAPVIPFELPTYPGEHAVITDEPVVVIGNVRSISMAEQTSWGVKTMANGALIGTRTFGALSALSPSPEAYSETYSGAFGESLKTAVYGYVPKYVALYDVAGDGHPQILEGKGISPTVEVVFDAQLYENTGRDNQLEAAIQYIKDH